MSWLCNGLAGMVMVIITMWDYDCLQISERTQYIDWCQWTKLCILPDSIEQIIMNSSMCSFLYCEIKVWATGHSSNIKGFT